MPAARVINASMNRKTVFKNNFLFHWIAHTVSESHSLKNNGSLLTTLLELCKAQVNHKSILYGKAEKSIAQAWEIHCELRHCHAK